MELVEAVKATLAVGGAALFFYVVLVPGCVFPVVFWRICVIESLLLTGVALLVALDEGW